MRCFYPLPSFDSVEAELEDVNDVEDEESDEQFPSMMIITRFSVGVPSKILEFRLFHFLDGESLMDCLVGTCP